MRFTQIAIPIVLLTTSSFCAAAAYSVSGNDPQSPANYTRWDGLAQFVNQPTRQTLFWCNGAETFSYIGDTDSLNAALTLFSQIDSSTHTVVFRPQTPQTKYDWELHIVQGIVRAWIEQNDMALVRDLDPTLVVYVSNKLDLDAVRIPPNVRLQQIANLRSRYLKAQEIGTEPTKSEATAYLKSLDANSNSPKLGGSKYKQLLVRIAAFIDRQSDPK